MSNVEAAPVEQVCGEGTPAFELVAPRDVPLGGPRAMTVRRTLPRRTRSLIGAWCFADHYGPDRVADTGGMQVPGHPHTGLQTVSWLFDGAIEHRDTTGIHTVVRPGELNLMTAGRGIAHSEFSTRATDRLHGVQLWVALPAEHRDTSPHVDHHVPPVLDLDGTELRLFLGSLAGTSSPVPTYSPLVGAQLDLPAQTTTAVPIDRSFEHGILVDSGTVEVDGALVRSAELGYLPPGRSSVRLGATGAEGARVLVLGGEPLGERIVMWWNFVGLSHDEIVAFRRDWQDERERGGDPAGRFGAFPPSWESTLPAPALPTARLRPRD